MCSCVDVHTCVQYSCVYMLASAVHFLVCTEVIFCVCGYNKRKMTQDDLSIQWSLTICYFMYRNWTQLAKVMHQNKGNSAKRFTGIAASIAHCLLLQSVLSFMWHRKITKSESECEQYLRPDEYVCACVIALTVITVSVASCAHIWLCMCTRACQRSACIHVWLEMTSVLLVQAGAVLGRALIGLPASDAWLQTDAGECVTAPYSSSLLSLSLSPTPHAS